MPVPKVSSESSFLENVPDSNLYVLRQEFQMEMEKVMAKLKSLEDQLLREVLEKEFAGHKADPDAKDVAQDTATNAPTEPNLPEEVEVIEVEQHEDKEHHVGMVHFSLSAWTYPVVLGLADAGPWDVVFSVLLMFLNFGMQVMFSYIILGVDFMGEEFEEQVAFAKRWRSSFAHDWKYVDLTSRSLVTRVCGGDGSLMLANRQATLVEHINSYMGLKHDEFEAGFFQTGILLCTLCILLWALCVYKEFRNIWLTLEGIWQLPRTPETVLRDNKLQSLSKLRFKWLASTCITRFVIATVLLISGTQWLARTTSITELMLNAVALNAILDVDEFLFAGFTPLSIQVAIEKLEPITIRQSRRRSQSESLVLFLLLLFTALFPYLALLQPLGQTMLAVKWNLCAGNQQFVVAKNTNSQVIVGFETGSALSEAANTVLQLAVEQQVHQSPDDRYGYYISFELPSIFERARSRTMAQESDQFSFCIETDHLDPGGSLHGDPVLWYNVAAPRLRTAAALLGREDVDSCEQAADLCNRTDAQLLRMVCGRTCNCTDPHHFPWLKVPAQGCQTSCLNEAVREFKWEQCQDQPTDGTWSELWDGYVPTLNHWLGADISQSTTFYNDILQWLAAVKALGCPALGDPKFKFEVTGARGWCAGDPNFFRPLALTCPVSCGCLAENPPSYCPPCSANSSASQLQFFPILVRVTMPTPSTGRNGSTAWSDNDAQVQETREFDLLRREFQAEVQKLSARLSLVEEGLRAHGNVVAEVERAVEPEIEPVKVDVEESFAGRDSLHHLHPESDVNFEESAWTYPLVIGLADAKPIDVCFAVILLLLNLCMQLIFSGIILGPDFLGEEFDTKKDVAQRWRTSFAHDYKYVDLSSTSLVTRVCSADGSLILATTQATLVTHINSYMGLLTDQFDAGFYQPGILLCLLCILLWTLCVYKEVRSIWLALEAVWQLPRSEHTVVHENAIVSLSKKRFMALLFTYITRFVIAWVLLIAGVQWLARTTSITELMLNAVALNAILDVDEFLYAGFTPVSLQVAIKHLEPVKVRYTAWRSQLESVVLFLLLLSTFILPYVSLLQPLGETMLAVKRELCYGNQTFVVGKNTQTQVILGYTTASERSGDLSVMERAVKDHKFSSAGDDARYIHFVPPGDFEKERTVTMEQESMDFTLCMETEMFHPSGSYYQDPVLTALVIPRLRTAAALGGIFDAESCEPLRGLCEGKDARQLRLICGDTCGCTDPLAFNWFRVPAYGCNDACLQIGLQKLNGQCQDVPNDENWHQLWDAYIPAVNAFIGGQLAESEALLEQVMQALSAIKQMGCSALAHPQLGMEIGSTRTWCEGNPTFFKSFAWKCPVSCGCTGPNPPSYCPSCSTSA